MANSAKSGSIEERARMMSRRIKIITNSSAGTKFEDSCKDEDSTPNVEMTSQDKSDAKEVRKNLLSETESSITQKTVPPKVSLLPNDSPVACKRESVRNIKTTLSTRRRIFLNAQREKVHNSTANTALNRTRFVSKRLKRSVKDSPYKPERQTPDASVELTSKDSDSSDAISLCNVSGNVENLTENLPAQKTSEKTIAEPNNYPYHCRRKLRLSKIERFNKKNFHVKQPNESEQKCIDKNSTELLEVPKEETMCEKNSNSSKVISSRPKRLRMSKIMAFENQKNKKIESVSSPSLKDFENETSFQIAEKLEPDTQEREANTKTRVSEKFSQFALEEKSPKQYFSKDCRQNLKNSSSKGERQHFRKVSKRVVVRASCKNIPSIASRTNILLESLEKKTYNQSYDAMQLLGKTTEISCVASVTSRNKSSKIIETNENLLTKERKNGLDKAASVTILKPECEQNFLLVEHPASKQNKDQVTAAQQSEQPFSPLIQQLCTAKSLNEPVKNADNASFNEEKSQVIVTSSISNQNVSKLEKVGQDFESLSLHHQSTDERKRMEYRKKYYDVFIAAKNIPDEEAITHFKSIKNDEFVAAEIKTETSPTEDPFEQKNECKVNFSDKVDPTEHVCREVLPEKEVESNINEHLYSDEAIYVSYVAPCTESSNKETKESCHTEKIYSQSSDDEAIYMSYVSPCTESSNKETKESCHTEKTYSQSSEEATNNSESKFYNEENEDNYEEEDESDEQENVEVEYIYIDEDGNEIDVSGEDVEYDDAGNEVIYLSEDTSDEEDEVIFLDEDGNYVDEDGNPIDFELGSDDEIIVTEVE